MKFKDRKAGEYFWDADVTGYRITESGVGEGLAFTAIFNSTILETVRGVNANDMASVKAALLYLKAVCSWHFSGEKGPRPEPPQSLPG